jgi:hypothetical protein
MLARGVEGEREGEEDSAWKRERGVVEGWGFGAVWCGAGSLGKLGGGDARRVDYYCDAWNMEGRKIRTGPEKALLLHEGHEDCELATR